MIKNFISNLFHFASIDTLTLKAVYLKSVKIHILQADISILAVQNGVVHPLKCPVFNCKSKELGLNFFVQ